MTPGAGQRSPAQAVRHYRDGLQRIVSCITPSVLVASGTDPGTPDRLTLTPAASLDGVVGVSVQLGFRFAVVAEAEQRHAWNVRETAMIWTIGDGDGDILAYHYHPEVGPEVRFPHLHVYRSRSVGPLHVGSMHLPSGTVSLAAFVRLLHREFGVPYLRADAERLLGDLSVAE